MQSKCLSHCMIALALDASFMCHSFIKLLHRVKKVFGFWSLDNLHYLCMFGSFQLEYNVI